jgi:hypothetical protein
MNGQKEKNVTKTTAHTLQKMQKWDLTKYPMMQKPVLTKLFQDR